MEFLNVLSVIMQDMQKCGDEPQWTEIQAGNNEMFSGLWSGFVVQLSLSYEIIIRVFKQDKSNMHAATYFRWKIMNVLQ